MRTLGHHRLPLYALLLPAMLCQGCDVVEATGKSDGSAAVPAAAEVDEVAARFTVSGALEGERQGAAWVRQDEYSRGHLFDIVISDSRDEAARTYTLTLRGESDSDAPPRTGEYPIVHRADPASGYASGFSASYMDIVENRASRYAHVALEYAMPPEWKQPDLSGTLVIDSVADGKLEGRFEFELEENASVNKAPLREEKILRVREGRFSAELPAG